MNTLIQALPTKPSRNEELKLACPTLAGTIRATLVNPAVDRFSDDDTEFLKFHGIYRHLQLAFEMRYVENPA